MVGQISLTVSCHSIAYKMQYPKSAGESEPAILLSKILEIHLMTLLLVVVVLLPLVLLLLLSLSPIGVLVVDWHLPLEG